MYGRRNNKVTVIVAKTADCDILWSVFMGTIEDATKRADKLNSEKPAEYMGDKIDWNEVLYFFADTQKTF